ncbi:MAG: GPP34 family phosphoprotein [Hyphomicrobiales bacterium]
MNISIAEKFILLQIHPSTGKLPVSYLLFGKHLIIAILNDLEVNDYIKYEDNRIEVISEPERLTAAHNIVFCKIKESYERQTQEYWVNLLCFKEETLKKLLLESLIEKDWIVNHHYYSMIIMEHNRYYIQNIAGRNSIVDEIKKLIGTNEKLIKENKSLLSLLEASKTENFYKFRFNNKQLKYRLPMDIRPVLYNIKRVLNGL